jgi:hypothetical protein
MEQHFLSTFAVCLTQREYGCRDDALTAEKVSAHKKHSYFAGYQDMSRFLASISAATHSLSKEIGCDGSYSPLC